MANEAKSAADKAKDAADADSSNGAKQEAAKKAQEAAGEAQEAADEAKEAGAAGDKAGAAKAKEAARKAMEKAKEAAKEAGVGEANGNDGQGETDKAGNKKYGHGSKEQQSSGSGEETNADTSQSTGEGGAADAIESDADLEVIRKRAQEVLDRYSEKLSGALGEFIAKCKSSMRCERTGLAVGVKNGNVSWNAKMKSAITSFVKARVFQMQRLYKRTYNKLNRRQGVVNSGDILIKGKQILKNTMDINVAFYIDRSGSMSGAPIKNVFEASYTICEMLKKQFGREKVVRDIKFKMYAFDMVMHEVPFGKVVNADGGNMDFSEIIEFIANNTKDYLINVIITDAQFSINAAAVKKFIKDIDGMLLFITNTDNDEFKELAKQYPTQMYYVLADSNFTIK